MNTSLIWQLLTVSILVLSITFGLIGNLFFIWILTRDKVLRKLDIVPLLVAFSWASLGQTVFIELLALHALITYEHLGASYPWICQAHQAAGFLFIPCSNMFLAFISVVRWLHYRGTAWIRRPRTRGRVFKRVSLVIILLSLSYSSIVFSGVPLSPNQYLFCDAYSRNQTVPIWFFVWDNGIFVTGFILPALITAGIYIRMFCASATAQQTHQTHVNEQSAAPSNKSPAEGRRLLARKSADRMKSRKTPINIRASGVTKGLIFIFFYGLISFLPLIIGRHFPLSRDLTHLFAALRLTNNSVVLLAFLVFCQVFRKGATLQVKRQLRGCGFRIESDEENPWVPVWSGMRSRYIWVQTTYIDQTDVKCSILLCEKRPGTNC